MDISITISENDLKSLVINHLQNTLGDLPLDRDRLRIEVKSKQNYKSEWEVANFRAVYEG